MPVPQMQYISPPYGLSYNQQTSARNDGQNIPITGRIDVGLVESTERPNLAEGGFLLTQALDKTPQTGDKVLKFDGVWERKKNVDNISAIEKSQLIDKMGQNPEIKKEEEKNIEDNLASGRNIIQADNVICKRLVAGIAYRSRNVYKSIVRHLYTYVKESKEGLTKTLKEVGFGDEEICGAFSEIEAYRNVYRPKDIERNSQVRIEKMLEKKSIFTFILRETLQSMIHDWQQGKYGQLSKTNCTIYLAACTKFYDETLKLLKGITRVYIYFNKTLSKFHTIISSSI